MQELLNSIKQSFPKYHDQVNQIFLKKTSHWDLLFSKDVANDMFRGVFYVIQDFLTSDKKRLFLRLPSAGLGRNDSDKDINQSELQKILVDIMFLATRSSWKKRVECPDIFNTAVGESYFFPDYLACNQKYGTVWEIKESKNDGKPRPQTVGKTFSFQDARDIFNRLRGTAVRLSYDGLTDSPNPRALSMYAAWINKYRNLDSLNPSIPIEKALLVGYSQRDWDDRPLSFPVLTDHVCITNNYAKVLDSGIAYDFIIFVGEKRYFNFEREINNAIAGGQVKKAVFIGTDIFDGFNDEQNDSDNQTFSFTYREIFTYFSRGNFPEIIFMKLQFDWLEQKADELLEKLPVVLDEDNRKRILRVALMPLLKEDGLDNINTSYLKDFLWNNYDFILSPEEIDSIVDWLQKAVYKGLTPKKAADNAIRKEKEKLTISLPASYKESLNKLVKTRNNRKNKIVIDVLNNDFRFVDVIKVLLQKGCLGTYYILSYFDLPNMYNFFADELKVYNSSERKRLLGIKYSEIKTKTGTVSNNLLDYYESSTDDLLSMVSGGYQGNRQPKYLCTFDNGESDEIYGDVIFYSGTKPIDELYSYKDDYLPCTVTYYKPHHDFQHLMELYYDFPKGQTVSSYSGLWKSVIQRIYSDKYAKNVVAMKRDFPFMEEGKLKQICRTSYKPLFPEEIGKISRTLYALGEVSEMDAILIKAASDVVGTHSRKAKELKNALFEYYLNGSFSVILDQIINNSKKKGEYLTISAISKESLVTVTINEINKLQ